jgi:ubiquinone/menaquinone biosynthesis C-methylase UbiE
MKKDWDTRALKNAYHYISSFRNEWDDDSFFRWGEIQTQAVIDKFFLDLKIDPAKLVILEIGCGAGRMSRALSSRFKFVYAYDVSDEYIKIAKKKNRNVQNIVFRSNDGLSFPEIADESIDFCFSGWTMLHMPTKEVVIKNIEEMSRFLKKGGLFKIDPPVEKVSLRHLILKLFSYLPKHIRPYRLKSNVTYIGTSLNKKEVMSILSQCGLNANISIELDGFERYGGKRVMKKWFYGRKNESPKILFGSCVRCVKRKDYGSLQTYLLVD